MRIFSLLLSLSFCSSALASNKEGGVVYQFRTECVSNDGRGVPFEELDATITSLLNEGWTVSSTTSTSKAHLCVHLILKTPKPKPVNKRY
jgi:hypothetical protein